MNPAIYLSYKDKADSMQKKPKLVSPLLKDKNELLTSYQSLPKEDKESIREFLKIVRNDEEQRKIIETEVKFIRKDKSNTPRLQELVRQFDYFNFELTEQKQFFQKEMSYNKVILMLDNLKRHDYSELIKTTHVGLKKGVGDFLECEKEPCLYLSNLSRFVYNNIVAGKIDEEVKSFIKDKKTRVYSEYFMSHYGIYVYDNSYKRFLNKFGKR